MKTPIEFRSSATWTIVGFAALSGFVAISVLGGVVVLFQRDGAPMERWVAAERSCVQYTYVSEREACVRARLISQHETTVAKQ